MKKCGSCGESITGKMINAMGQSWHFDHFVCQTCNQPVGTSGFYERNKKPVCKTCHKTAFSPKCAQCGEPVVGRCMSALGKQWHPEHFTCQGCGTALGEKVPFMEKNGVPFCQSCYCAGTGLQCGGCAQNISGGYMTAMDRNWHPQCFVCTDCRKSFDDGSFYEIEKKPYCEEHYHIRSGNICASCEKPISGQCVTALGAKWHVEHFLCAFCQNDLNINGFREKDGKPYCHECFSRLFG